MGRTSSKCCESLHNMTTPFTRNVLNRSGQTVSMDFIPIRELGEGSFATVYMTQVRRQPNGQIENVALKHPAPECGGAKRELDLLLMLEHKNICNLVYYYEEAMDFHLAIELVEGGDLFHFLKNNFSHKHSIGIFIELFTFQLFRGLAHCHSLKICHRDIKPENLLVDATTGCLKITDFGSGTTMENPDEPHTWYVGTIFRAPELLLGSANYSFKVDSWSAATVLTEMILGRPIFYHGVGAKGYMVRIFAYLGLPTDEDFTAMRAEKIPLPQEIPHETFEKTFEAYHVRDMEGTLSFLQNIFTYDPNQRMSAWEACAHKLFNVLREPDVTLPNGRTPLPDLFDFTVKEVSSMPPHVRQHFGV